MEHATIRTVSHSKPTQIESALQPAWRCLVPQLSTRRRQNGAWRITAVFQWLSEHLAYSPQQVTPDITSAMRHLFKDHFGDPKLQQPLISKHRITASLATCIEFFPKGIPLMKPRVYCLRAVTKPPYHHISTCGMDSPHRPSWHQERTGMYSLAA